MTHSCIGSGIAARRVRRASTTSAGQCWPGTTSRCGVEPLILAHISEIGTKEPDGGGAEFARGGGREKEGKQFGIRAVERRDEKDGATGNLGLDPQIGLPIGKVTRYETAVCGAERMGNG